MNKTVYCYMVKFKDDLLEFVYAQDYILSQDKQFIEFYDNDLQVFLCELKNVLFIKRIDRLEA